jgi:hypothetical protein
LENRQRTIVKTGVAVVALALDRNGDVVIGDKKKLLKKYNKQKNSWEVIGNFASSVHAITFDSKNNFYLITDKGIFDATLNKYFFPDSVHNINPMFRDSWYKHPAYLMDKNDNIWIGFGFGEWGGDLFIFNAASKKFIEPLSPKFLLFRSPVKSIFEGDDGVYVTRGLMHFSVSGSILRFKDLEPKLLFDSPTEYDSDRDTTFNGEYIGPGAYNSRDGYIYFYSQNGFFKGDPRTDLSAIEKWTKVVKPRLRWSNGQPDAIGSPMNVFKMMFIGNKLVFVSQNDGIGVYDGKAVVMMK